MQNYWLKSQNTTILSNQAWAAYAQKIRNQWLRMQKWFLKFYKNWKNVRNSDDPKKLNSTHKRAIRFEVKSIKAAHGHILKKIESLRREIRLQYRLLT